MRAERILAVGEWDAALEIDRVRIDFDGRFRRRIVLTTEKGRELLLDLPQAARLRDVRAAAGDPCP
jgi:urease accessory protein